MALKAPLKAPFVALHIFQLRISEGTKGQSTEETLRKDWLHFYEKQTDRRWASPPPISSQGLFFQYVVFPSPP
jgi:hypothetical protein